MKYKIGDVSKILGISADAIRYYERKGIVSPEKDRGNDYRFFDAWDINFLTDCLWFKPFGFPIEQIALMVRSSGLDELDSYFEKKEEELRDSIDRSQLLLRRAEEYRLGLERAKALLYKCEIAESPELIRAFNRVGDEYFTDAGAEWTAKTWSAALPFSRRYFEMSGEAYLPGREKDYRWGYALNRDYAEKLGIDAAPPLVTVPSRRCVHTVFKNSSGRGGFSPSLLQYALDFAAGQGIDVFGPIYGVLLASAMENGSLTGYFEAWLPIE